MAPRSSSPAPDTGPVRVPALPGQFFAGVRFRPGKAPGFLGADASELLDLRVPLADLWGRASAERLAGRLASATSPEGAASILDDAVADGARTAPAAEPIIDDLLAMFMATHPGACGAVKLASLTMCMSERRLYRHCRAAVGYGPKTLDRVLRFQRARRMLETAARWRAWRPRPATPTRPTSPGNADDSRE